MNEKSILTDALSHEVTRRSFLKWSAVVGGAAALAGGGLEFGLHATEAAPTAAPVEAEAGVSVVPTGCCHNCGGRCVLKAWVKDGTIVRITTDDRPDIVADPQLRACPRGRSYRRRVYSPDRLKYPMKRVGERGEGKFERISWDEAATLIANEMQRVKAQYGPSAFFNHYGSGGGGLIMGSGMTQRLLGLFGGYLNYYNSYSSACTRWATPYSLGTFASGNSPDDWVNSKLILLWGFNPAETIFGTNTTYRLRLARDAGAKIIVIDPRLSMTAQALADDWIPIRAGTDNALMDAMAYVMIKEGLHDQAFLDKYCLGFDEEHLPKSAPKNSSYKAYVLGDADGQPKTPQWAEYYTQIPAERIVKLAREYATTKPAALIPGLAFNRRAYGEQPVRGSIALAAMTGNIGIAGGCAAGATNVTSRSVPVGGLSAVKNSVTESIPVFRWTDAVLRGKEMGTAEGVISLPEGQKTLRSNIKFIFNTASNTLINQHSNINRTDKILRDTSLVEYIVVIDQFMTPSAKYADVLLPAVTWMEKNDMATVWGLGDSLIFMNKVIDPMYECKTDYEIAALIAEKLGLKDQFTGGKTELQWLEEMVKTSQKADPTFPSFDEFRKRGVHVFKYPKPYVAFEDFRQDPVKNALKTPSGKVEIYSEQLAKMNIENLPAVAKFIPEWEGGPWDSLYEKYPLQAFGRHYQRRAHSTYDNIDWLEEAMPQRMFMNPIDAQARGIQDGDMVRVFNDRGQLVLPVRLTSRIMPGLIDIPQGAWWTPDKSGVDVRGSINVLTSERPTPGARGNPQHTNLVQVEKVSGGGRV